MLTMPVHCLTQSYRKNGMEPGGALFTRQRSAISGSGEETQDIGCAHLAHARNSGLEPGLLVVNQAKSDIARAHPGVAALT